MGIEEPKLIYLTNGKIAVTGERMLIFVNENELTEQKSEIQDYVINSFKNKQDFNLQFRADINTLSVTILPTMDCNLRCTYCYADGGIDPIKLNFGDIACFLNQLISKYPDCNKINLYFAGGGEPLLNFDLINEVVNYVKQKGLIPDIKIVTNGILIQKYFDWLKENKVNLRISYDGSAQNTNRPGYNFNSNDVLIDTFKFLKKNYPPELLTVQLTVTSSNVFKMCEDVEKIILEYGIDTVKLEPVHYSFSNRSKNVSQPSPEEFTVNFLKTIDNMVSKEIKGYLDISYLSIPSTCYFCSIRNQAILSPYNLLIPCVEVIKKGLNDDVILSDDFKNINFDKISVMQQKKLYKYHSSNFPKCSNCNLVHICKINCPMRIILFSKDKPYDYNCMMSHILIPKFLERASENEKYLHIVYGDDFNKSEKCI